MADMTEHPRLLHTVLDTTDVRGLAEFYRELLGLRYRPGDEPPPDGTPDDAEWLVLDGADGDTEVVTLVLAVGEGLAPGIAPEVDAEKRRNVSLGARWRREREQHGEH